MNASFSTEIAKGQRFQFGKNWMSFLGALSEARINDAQDSLTNMLGVDTLQTFSFLDVGCGSGLFSLAARRLGAKVCSFDYDPTSVACAEYLKLKHFPSDGGWNIQQGSALDQAYLAGLGQFDVVYSWGVLHHTGAMYQALENIVPLVKPGGKLFIAIYNDQGWVSRYWLFMKRNYNRSLFHKTMVFILHSPYFLLLVPLIQFLKGKRKLRRGMSRWHDIKDWLGGYPFEVATPEKIFRFYRDRGFQLIELSTCGGRQGCNQYVFQKSSR